MNSKPKQPTAAEIAYWRNERTRQQAELAKEKKLTARVNRMFLENRYLSIEDVFDAVTDTTKALGKIAGRAERQERVPASEVVEIYDALQPLTSVLFKKIHKKINGTLGLIEAEEQDDKN